MAVTDLGLLFQGVEGFCDALETGQKIREVPRI